MKFCIINSLYYPYMKGGAEKVVLRVVQGLIEQGHQITVITLGEKKANLDFIIGERGEKIYRIRPLNLFSFLDIDKKLAVLRIFWHILDVFNFDSYFIVKKILQKEKPDIVMSHNLKGIGYLVPLVLKKYKWVQAIHDVQLSFPSGLIIKGEENNYLYNSIFRKVYERICRFLFDSPDFIISPSQWLINFYIQKGFFKNSKRIYLPSPVEKVASNNFIEFVNNKNEINLLYIGQIEEHKGIIFLLDVLAKNNYEMAGHKINLYVAGKGSLIDIVKEKVKNFSNVRVLGFINEQQINEIFPKMDFSIVPTLCYENSPTVIHESLGFGVPVIVADIGGAAELVKENFNGYVFKAGDPIDLSLAIKKAIYNKNKWSLLKRNAIITMKDCTLENYVAKLIYLINK